MAPTTRITSKSTEGPEFCSAPEAGVSSQAGDCVELMGLQVRLTQAEADYAQAEARVQLQRTLLAHWVSIFPSSSAPSLESLLACPSRTLMTSAPEDSNRGSYSPGGLQFPEFYLQKHNPRQPYMSPDLGLRAGDAIPLRGSASSATSPRCSSHASLGEEDDDAPVVLDRCRFWTVDEGCRQRMVRRKVAVGPGPGVFLPFLGVVDGAGLNGDEALHRIIEALGPDVGLALFGDVAQEADLGDHHVRVLSAEEAVVHIDIIGEGIDEYQGVASVFRRQMGLLHSEVTRRDVDAGQSLIVGGTLASDRVEANKVPRLEFPVRMSSMSSTDTPASSRWW
ncbi:hypothetical protein E4U35_004997 [Claviceps purpurea]|nr:hypothetical protein E4U35_004997 [Claviceps purpurea]